MILKEEDSFFEQERHRLATEITSVSIPERITDGPNTCFKGFEELLSLTNVLNRQVEEVSAMSTEYETVASLWNTFHALVQEQDEESIVVDGETAGVPGTGGHIISNQRTS
jgi:DASH complex subunit DAD1